VKIFCKHDWTKVSDEILGHSDDFLKMIEECRSMAIYNKKHVAIFKCIHCGKLQKFVTDLI